MIKQNIKNNLKLSCYPPHSNPHTQDKITEQKPLLLRIISLTFYAPFLKKSAKRCETHRKSDTVTLSKYKKDPIQSKKAALSLF